jgi:hypothetical protein
LQAVQLSKGQTKKGGQFPSYSKRSVEEFGKQPGPWRLKDTGSLYASLKVMDVNNFGWKISASSVTFGLVSARLNKLGYKQTDILGLNNKTLSGGAENPALATEVLLPEIKIQAQKQTGFKI